MPRNDHPDCRYHTHLRCLAESIKANRTTKRRSRHTVRNTKGANTAQFDLKDIEDPYMPFGKFGPKGDEGPCRISELPDSYLLWLLEKAENGTLTPTWLNNVVKEEWKRRGN